MAYQPFPASSAPAAPPSAGRRNPVLLVVGIVVLVAGLVGGIALVLGASSSTEDSVKRLGRAVPGCETTLDFKETGTFLVFFERAGSTADLPGGCSAAGGDFTRDDGDVPDQTLTLADSDGKDVDIGDDSGVSYDVGGFKGEQIGKLTIDDSGEYTLTVTPDDASDTDYAIALGKDPTANESTMRLAGIAVLVGGVLIGVVLVLFGLRRRSAGPGGPGRPAVVAPGSWAPAPPVAAWPTSPSAPPTGPPVYGSAPTYGNAPAYGTPPGWAGSSTPPSWGRPGAPAPPGEGAWPPADPTRPQPAPDPFSRPPDA